jgi:hypothetical protein
MQTWEQRFDAITTSAWEAWTKNGLDLDQDDIGQTIKTAQDAATNAWAEGMTDKQWLEEALSILSHP